MSKDTTESDFVFAKCSPQASWAQCVSVPRAQHRYCSSYCVFPTGLIWPVPRLEIPWVVQSRRQKGMHGSKRFTPLFPRFRTMWGTTHAPVRSRVTLTIVIQPTWHTSHGLITLVMLEHWASWTVYATVQLLLCVIFESPQVPESGDSSSRPYAQKLSTKEELFLPFA